MQTYSSVDTNKINDLVFLITIYRCISLYPDVVQQSTNESTNLQNHFLVPQD